MERIRIGILMSGDSCIDPYHCVDKNKKLATHWALSAVNDKAYCRQSQWFLSRKQGAQGFICSAMVLIFQCDCSGLLKRRYVCTKLLLSFSKFSNFGFICITV